MLQTWQTIAPTPPQPQDGIKITWVLTPWALNINNFKAYIHVSLELMDVHRLFKVND